MYGIGVFEIAAIFLVLILFFKPEDIYRLFRKGGQWYSRIKKTEKEIQDILESNSPVLQDDKAFGFDIDENNNKEKNS